MTLKQDIVVVNEFSVPLPGRGGSRGSTPGSYVSRYMARDSAVETLAPVRRLRTDDFIERYMARQAAVDHAITRDGAKEEMRQAQGDGGVAFGYGSASLSDQQLRQASADIQNHFESGKTVLKTVLSFDEAYLKRQGIIDADFHCRNRGDYRGHLDQMKLRLAVMRGLENMSAGSGGFDELRYVGVIQVDTEHVHCHLAMVDAGRGHLAHDGTQRGKLLDRHKSRLRRGLDAWLDEKQAVAHLSSAVGYERRNVMTYIKRWAHESMREESLPQFLLACLPADRRLWRSGTNDRRMRKANELMTHLVTEQLERTDSPMPAAMGRVVDYANQRREREGLDTEEWQRLIDHGRDQIHERASNAVYAMLRALPSDELVVRTPMLEVMGMDYQQMAVRAESAQSGHQDEELISFGFKLRNYASRLRHHRDRARIYRDLSAQWSKAKQAGVAEEASRPLHDFYRAEADYHRRLMAKYQQFLPIVSDAGAWYDQQEEVADFGQQLISLTSLRHDPSLQRMKDSDQAERIGREIYEQPGGRLLTQGAAGREVLDHRIETMRTHYREKVDGLRTELAESGLVLEAVETGSGKDQTALPEAAGFDIRPGVGHPFDEVKALDLHHLGYDFFADVRIGSQSLKHFTDQARDRDQALQGAVGWLKASGQEQAVRDLPIADVAAMKRCAAELAARADDFGMSLLPSRFAELRQQRQDEFAQRGNTTALDSGLDLRVRGQVRRALSEMDGEIEAAEPAVERTDHDLQADAD